MPVPPPSDRVRPGHYCVAVVASVALGVVTLTELLSAHPPGPVTSGDEGRADATHTGPDAPDPVRDPG